jgi:NAD+ kinase
LKFGIFVHPKRPKVPVDKILKRIKSAGASYSQEDPDVAIVVGGDGTFGYYGRTLSIPMLFVGVRDVGVAGSMARLAEIFYDDFVEPLHDIEAGRYSVIEKKMLSARLKGHSADVLTDVYLERGKFAGCLRYATLVKPSDRSKFLPFSDYAIGNGVIISTSFGAGGYFSYPERLWPAERGRTGPAGFADDRIGICHIIPTYLARKRKGTVLRTRQIRYTVPLCSTIQIKLLRDANARLYGTTVHSKGVPVRLGDTISVTPSKRTAKIIKLRS